MSHVTPKIVYQAVIVPFTAAQITAGEANNLPAGVWVLNETTNAVSQGNPSGSPLLVATSGTAPKDNFAGTTAPVVSNDSTQGYSVGSRWVNTVADESYICVDASTGAAVWSQTTVGTIAEVAGLQAALDAKAASTTVTAHTGSVANPHGVTKAQVGLGSADNTTDALKPISTATATALAGKAGTAVATTTVAGLMAAADKTKLDGVATGAEVNVQADWTAVSGDALIVNKPTSMAPTAHKASHATAGADALTPADIGAAAATTLDAALRIAAFTAAWGSTHQVDASAAGFTVTVPTAVGNTGSFIELVRRDASANVITVRAAAGQVFDQLAAGTPQTFTLGPRGSVRIFSNGTNPIVVDTSGVAAVSRLWLPSDASAAPVVWFSFRDLTRMTLVGSTVSAMTNRGSLGATHDLLQAVAASRPTLDNAAAPSYATFDGGDALLSLATADSIQNGSVGSFGAAYTHAASRASSLFVQVPATGGQLNFHPKWTDANTYVDMPMTSSRASGNVGTVFGGDANVYSVVATRNAANMSAHARGNPTAALTKADATGASTGTAPLNLGSGAGDNFHLGRIYEFVYYRVELSADERQRLAAYMLWAAGEQAQLHASNAYRSAPPTVSI